MNRNINELTENTKSKGAIFLLGVDFVQLRMPPAIEAHAVRNLMPTLHEGCCGHFATRRRFRAEIKYFC